MTKEEILAGLEELVLDRESFIDDNPEPDCIFVQDKVILQEAIRLIRGGQAVEEPTTQMPAEKRDALLALTDGGFAAGGLEAIRIFEQAKSEMDGMTEESCQHYERALNWLRYLVRKNFPTPPREREVRYIELSCGRCGQGLNPGQSVCPRCGTRIDWNQWREEP